MYNMDKEKLSRKHHKNNPSFSSTLLDEIYRSIDGYDQRREDFKLPKETKTYNNNDGTKSKYNSINKKSSIEEEEIASFRRARLVEKWMEKKVKDKILLTKKMPELVDTDSLLFSSSSSSESNSGTLSVSSSENDSFYTEKTSRNGTTCFAAPRTKSIRRATVSPRMRHSEQTEFYLFDDYHHNKKASDNAESFIKSKSRALKIYNNLKKVKQPISPGGRLTSFLSSIFTNNSDNGNVKKSKNLKDYSEKRGAASSTCSSATSFSRSCLSKTPQKFRDNNGVKRTVTFNPVGVIVDEDCRPCGHKCIYDQDSGYELQKQQSKFQGNGAALMDKNKKFVEVTKVNHSLKSYQRLKKKNDYIVDYVEEEFEDEDEDDAASDSSSDLFEIDHLAFFGNNRFCEELPVYETTNFSTSRGIATGFIR